MSQVAVFERFIDALDRRSSQITTFDRQFDYKAGFMHSMLEQIAKESPEARAKLMMATRLLEEWGSDQEARDRKWSNIEG
jgi:hypothetical protein